MPCLSKSVETIRLCYIFSVIPYYQAHSSVLSPLSIIYAWKRSHWERGYTYCYIVLYWLCIIGGEWAPTLMMSVCTVWPRMFSVCACAKSRDSWNVAEVEELEAGMVKLMRQQKWDRHARETPEERDKRQNLRSHTLWAQVYAFCASMYT